MQVEKRGGGLVDRPPLRKLVVVRERVTEVRRIHVDGPARVRSAQLFDHRHRLRFGKQRIGPALRSKDRRLRMTRDVGGDKTGLVVGRPIARDLFDDARGVSRLSGSFPGADLGVPRRHVSGRILARRRVAAALQTRLIEVVDVRLLLDAERHGAIAVGRQDAIRRPSVGLKGVHQVGPRVFGHCGGDAERSARG